MQIQITTSTDLNAIPEGQRAKAAAMYDAWQAGRELRNAIMGTEPFTAAIASQDKIPEQFVWDTELERAL